MKQKIKQLQSSGETRKTNRPWHFLSTLNSLLLSKLLLLLIIPAMGMANAWGSTPVTWTPSSSDITTLTNSTGANISVGTNADLFKVYAVRNSTNNDTFESGEGLQFSDNSLYKSGIAVYVPTTSNDIESIQFYLRTTKVGRDPKYAVVDAIGLSSDPTSATLLTMTTSYASYSPFASPQKGKYYIVGGQYNGSGKVYLQKIVVTFASGVTKYAVTYNGNENTSGSAPSDATEYTYNDEVTVLGNTGSLAKTGYTFNGWNTEDDGGGTGYSASDKFNITDNTTLYAQWAANNYTVTIDANGGTGSTSVTATYGSALPSFTAPTKDSSTLTGYWTGTNDGTKIINADGSLVDNVSGYTEDGGWIYDDDKTLYAQWQENTADKFHFVAKTSSSTNSVDATTEKQIVTSTSPTSGQVNLATTLDGGSLYYKTKESRDCKSGILFATHSGAYDYLRVVLPSGSALQNGDVITCSISGSTGRCLAFTTSTTWSDSYTTSGDTYTVTAGDGLAGKTEFYVWRGYATSTRLTELTITGYGSVTTYSVTYNGNDESTGEAPVDASSYVAGTSVTVLGNTGSLTKDNYTFAGWNSTANGSGTKYAPGSNFNISSDVMLYAVWKHEVDLNVNNASMGSISATYATADSYYGKAIGDAFTSGDLVSHDVQLTLTAIPNTGYHFAGSWGSGTGATSNPATVPVGDNKNYIANFAANEYSVTLDLHGGEGDDNVTATYNAALPSFNCATLDDNALTGYWTAASDGTKVINADGTLVPDVTGYTTADGKWINTSDDVTLHAQWTAAVTLYTVTFSGNDHGTPASGSVTQATQGGNITLPTCTASTYYEFIGWSTSAAAATADYAAGASYKPEANETLYAVYKWQLLSQVSPAGAGSVVMRYTDEHGDVIPSGSYISKGANIWVEATANPGYTFRTWSNGSTSTDNPLTFTATSVSAKTMIANFEPVTSTITILANGGTANGSVKATYNSSSLSSVVAPTHASKSLVGTFTAAEGGIMVIDGGANLVPNREGYTDANGKWINTDATVELYAQWRDADEFSTALPYTYDFTDSEWVTVGNTYPNSTSSPQQVTAKDGSHVIYFRGTSTSEIQVVSGQHLQVNSNGSTNHYIAIPVSGINGRLDVTVEAPYTSGFKVRAYLDTSHGTTIQTNSPGSLGAKSMEYTATNTFVYREKDLTATRGVLYISVNSSSYKLIDKITVSTPTKYLVPTPESVIMGDGETATVTIKNHSAQYKPVMKTGVDFPSYLDEKATTFNPSTGELVIVAKAIGEDETIKFALDTDGDGQATSTDLEIPVTVQGVTMGASPTSAVYAYGAGATSLSVSATQNDGGTLKYQWYRNTVNSTVGGTAISGATSASYTPSTTLAAEDASFYYCVVSSSKSTSLPKTSGVAYVLTSSTGRYFQMSNVAGNKTTSEASLVVTGQKVAGGEATYYKGSSDGKYVLRFDNYPHYFHSSDDSYFEIQLPTGTTLAATDVVSVTVNAIDGSQRGVRISASSDFLTGYDFTTTNNESTPVSATASTANLTGANKLYVRKYGSKDGYFTDLIIYTPGTVKITDPASQTIQSGEVPAPLTVTASDGSGNFSFQWQKKVGSSAWGDVSTPEDGTVTTEGATSTFAPVALTTTTLYRCTVTDNTSSISDTSEAATITVTSLTHGWYTPASYTDNKATYLLTESSYDTQNSGSVTVNNHYWTVNGTKKNAFTTKTIDGTEAKYMRISSGKDYNSSTFYVKGASAFTFRAGNGAERYYNITVDGVDYGQFEADPTVETQSFPLKESGSVITFDQPTTEIILARLTFYNKQPATIIVRDAEGAPVTKVTQYAADGFKEYTVESNSAGTINQVVSSDPTVATATYDGGVLTVTPLKSGLTNITIHQVADGNYAEATATLAVTVQKYDVIMSFSYDKVVLKESEVSANTAIDPVKLPKLTVTRADGSPHDAEIHWDCDEKGLVTVVGSGNSDPAFTATYRTGQGGARIFAYVNETENYAPAMAYFDLVVERGFSNNLPNGESIKVQQQYTLEDNSGNAAVVLTYGGYKYLSDSDKTKKWSKSAAKGKYFIDGYKYYTRNEEDALNEYSNQLKGMLDDPTDSSCPDGLWYKTDEVKPNGGYYGEYERIRPFALPCRGGYLKFEPKQSGILTAYVWQNGVIGRGSGKANQIGSKPRLGYWFDQDGWVQHPVVDPVSKQPISNGNGRNTHVYNEENLDQQMTSQWLAKNGDAAIIPMLRSRYTDSEDPDLNSSYSDTNIGYENPYWWPENADVIDNNNQMIPRKMKPVPYHNGFMVPEESYVKYTINVVAGKTYYFYGMMTKVGYVGMNFVPDESVLTTGGNDIAHRTEPLHLQTNDDMTTYKIGGSVLAKNTVVDEVTLPSNYRAEKWNTICLPFALSEDQVKEAFGEGTELAIFNGLRHDAANHIYYVRYLRHVDQNILPGQPYLIYPTGVDASGNPLATVGDVIGAAVEGQSGTRLTFNHVFIDKGKLKQDYTSYGSDEDADGNISYVFTGTYAQSEIGKYDLYNRPKVGDLVRYMPENPSTVMSLNTYHAFIDVKSATMMQDGITFDFEAESSWDPSEGGEPTKVIMIGDDGVKEMNRVANGKSYNMMGQQVDPTSAKGIILVDGKKVMY